MNFAYSLNDLICYDDNKNFISSLGERYAVIKKIRVSKHFLDFDFEMDPLFLSKIESLNVIHNKKNFPLDVNEQNYYKVHIDRLINGLDEISIEAYTKHGKVKLRITDTLKRKKEALLGNFIIQKDKKKIVLKREGAMAERIKKIKKGFKNS